MGTNLYLEGVWADQSFYTGPFTLAQASAVGASLLKRCGEVDGGVPVGLINDPRSCRYMPGSDGVVFTSAQNQAYQRILTGAVNKQGRIAYGPALGSELDYSLAVPPFAQSDPGVYTPISMEEYAQGFLQYLAPYLQRSRTFTMTGFNFNTNTYQLGPIRGLIDESGNPNLRTYAARGGKVILYHGWADALIPTYDSVAYVEDVWKTMGFNAASNTLRAFFVPGMGHCGDALGGYGGPDTFDMVTPLIDWVEAGIAPKSVIASAAVHRVEPGLPFSTAPPVPVLTRPLCAYPTTAKYVSGNPFMASSFTCGPGLTGIPNPVAPGASTLPATELRTIRHR
jgi:feruloyl esterase